MTHRDRYPIQVILLFLLVVLIEALRSRNAVLFPILHNEDGRDLFAYYTNNPQLLGLFRFYAGYVALLPNLVGYLAARLPPPLAPYWMVLFSLALQGISFTLFSLRRFRFFIQDDRQRILFCVLLAALPLGNFALTTAVMWSGWHLFWILLVLTYAPLGSGRVGQVIQFIFSLLAALSHPFSLLLAPLFVFNLIVRKTRADRLYNGGLLTAVILYAIFWVHPGDYPTDSIWVSLPASIKFLFQRVIFGSIFGNQTRFDIFSQGYARVIYAIAVLVLLGLGLLVYLRRDRFTWRELVRMVLFAGVLELITLASVAGRAMVTNYIAYTNLWNQRYYYSQQIIFLLLVFFILSRVVNWQSLKTTARILITTLLVCYVFAVNIKDYAVFRTSAEDGQRVAQFLHQVYARQTGQLSGTEDLVFDRGMWTMRIQTRK